MGNGAVNVLTAAFTDADIFLEKTKQANAWLYQTKETDLWQGRVLEDPCTICAEEFFRDGVLSAEEWDSMDFSGEEGYSDPDEQRENRYILMTMAYERSNISTNPEFCRFLAENGQWLEDCALFLALDGFFRGLPWQNWPEDIRCRRSNALDYYRREFYFDTEFQLYLQFLCHRQRSHRKNGR